VEGYADGDENRLIYEGIRTLKTFKTRGHFDQN